MWSHAFDLRIRNANPDDFRHHLVHLDSFQQGNRMNEEAEPCFTFTLPLWGEVAILLRLPRAALRLPWAVFAASLRDESPILATAQPSAPNPESTNPSDRHRG
jgi:hypothetical protein